MSVNTTVANTRLGWGEGVSPVLHGDNLIVNGDQEADSWLAVVAPRGLPAGAKAKLQEALAETMADAEIRDKLIANGLQPAYEPAAAVAARIEDELPRMRAVAQRANIRAE